MVCKNFDKQLTIIHALNSIGNGNHRIKGLFPGLSAACPLADIKWN